MALHHTLGWEEVELVNLFLKDNIKENIVIFDIGANRGLFVDLFLGSEINYRAHCFEPIKTLYQNLVLKYLDNKKVVLNNIGVSNHNGLADFNELTDLETDGCSSLIERPVFKDRGWEYNKYEIEVKTIDSYCKENKIEFVDFIKIDVEGCEFLVFEGMKDLIKSRKVGLIQFEYGDTFLDGGFSLKSIYYLAKEFNYTLGYYSFCVFNEINEENIGSIIGINNINLIFKKND